MPDYWHKDILVLGCGNILFGDDGFGPCVADYFRENINIPPGVCVLNCGLSVREILFNVMLMEQRPKKIIIVDAIDDGRPVGDLFHLDISNIPLKKIDDFSMHQLPTSNLLKELKENCGVTVEILCAQVGNIPEEVSPGLSKEIEKAIPIACEKITGALK